MTRARAAPDAGFKRCCLLNGDLDGSDHDYFFQGEVITLEFASSGTI
jgi:hypothetical protein